MAEEEIKHYYRDKGTEILVHIGTIIADIALLGFWLLGEYCMEHFLVPRFPVDTTMAKVTLSAFRVLFPVSTLIPCASKIRRHIVIMWMRDSAAIRSVKEEIRVTATIKRGHETE